MKILNVRKNNPSFVLVGGFLGAGKSSVIRALTALATDAGLRCGLVTNDQGEGLVDSALARETGAAVQEVPSGCFCCRADSLMAALGALEKVARPDLYLAEPVGSCTDLVATVLRPIQEIYKLPLRLAPMLVVVDALRFQADFAGGRKKAGKGFSKGVRYIWDKQLEEAEVVLLNKVDGLEEGDAGKIVQRIEHDWPGKQILLVSTRTGLGIAELFRLITSSEAKTQPTMALDYAMYGAGEAELGWLNAQVTVTFKNSSAVDAWLLNLAANIQAKVEAVDGEIAHLKLSLTSAENSQRLAVVQGVRNGTLPQATSLLYVKVKEAEITVNLRAEAAPEALEAALRETLDATAGDGISFVIHDLQAFSPGQPKPTHRIVAA